MIKVIAQALLEEHSKLLSVEEFDQLYELDEESLRDVKNSILRQMRSNQQLVK